MKKHELKLWVRSLGPYRYLYIALPMLVLPFFALLIHLFFPPDHVSPWIHMLFLTVLPLFSIIPPLEIIDSLVSQSSIESLQPFIQPGYRWKASILIFGIFYSPGLAWMFIFSWVGWVELWLILYLGPLTIWLFFHFYALAVISKQSRIATYSLILYSLVNFVLGTDFPNFPMFFTQRPPSGSDLLSSHLLYIMSSLLWMIIAEKKVPLGRKEQNTHKQ